MNLGPWFDSVVCVRVVLTLTHFLWQGLVLALLAGLARLAFRRLSARVRYGVLVTALAPMAACPPATYCLIDVPARVPGSRSDSHGVWGRGNGADGLRRDAEIGELAAMSAPAPGESTVAEGRWTGAASSTTFAWERYAPFATAIYLLGVVLLLGRVLLGLHGGQRLCRRSQPVHDREILRILARQVKSVGLRFTPVVAFCRDVGVPTVVGVLRPTVLLPLCLVSGLTAEEVEGILCHELAHIRRYDHLVNLAQRLVEAMLFFHPAVWLISHWIRTERENCCDDFVVAFGVRPLTYAGALVRVAELNHPKRADEPLAAIVGLYAALRPSHLRRRILRLIGGPVDLDLRLTPTWAVALGAMALVALAAPVVLSLNAAEERAQQGAEDGTLPKSSDLRPANTPTAWGEERGGLRFGLRFKDPQCVRYAVGERIPIELLAHNTTDHVIAFAFETWPHLVEHPPKVVDVQGHAVGPEELRIWQGSDYATRELQPGEVVMLVPRELEFRTVTGPQTQRLRTWAQGGPGKYKISQSVRLAPQPVVPNKAIEHVYEQATGELAVEIAVDAHDSKTPLGKLSGTVGISTSPSDETKVTDLLRKLEAGNAETQKKVVIELAGLGPSARPAVGQLTKLLESQDQELRTVAACALLKIDPQTKGLERIFRHALGSGDEKVREMGAFGLATMVPAETVTIPALVNTLADEDAQTAEFASAALARMGKPAVDALIGGLDSNNNQRRQLAASALGKIGKSAEDAVPELIKLLQDHEGRVCNEAATALGSFAPEHKEAIPHLLQTMKTYGSNYVATSAAQSLGKFGPPVLPVLREVLRDEQSEARYAVKWALEAMGRQAVTEGAVLYVFPDGKVRVWLGGEGALKVGEVLHVQRPAADGSRLVAATIVVKAVERFTAICQVLQGVRPGDVPLRGGDVVTSEKGTTAPAPASSQTDAVEAFLARVESPKLPRKTRVTRHLRNSAGQITELRLKGVQLDASDFALLGNLRSMEILDLSETNVADEDLRHLKGHQGLHDLALWHTTIGGAGLAYLGTLRDLERLNLGDTKITDDALHHLRGLRKLRHLVLTRNNIADSGVQQLCELGSLESLKLGETNVTDEGLRLLRGLKNLRGLTLDQTKVTDAGLIDFARLPGFAWMKSSIRTAGEFVRRIESGDFQSVDEMRAVGLEIPARGRFRLGRIDPIPPDAKDVELERCRFHLEMRWTVEAERLDATFYADFTVNRGTVMVYQVGIRDPDRTLPTPDLPERRKDGDGHLPASQDAQRSPDSSSNTMEGAVLDVRADGTIRVSLGSQDGLKLGDRLHVRRQTPDGSSRSLAVIVVKTLESRMASCVILHELADPPPHLPLEEGDIVARRCPVGKVVSVQGDIVEISLGEDARLVRGERIFVCRDATPGTKEYVAEAAVEMIGEKSTACKLLPGRESRERMPIRRGDWALPHRTEFFNMDFRGAEEKEDDGAAQVDQGSVAAVGSVPKMN